MAANMSFYFHLLATSIRASMSLRAAFLMQAGLMVVNNIVMCCMWWLFFLEFRTVSGWQVQDMMALIAIGAGSYGLLQICFGGTRDLAKIIINGDLDPFITQPKNILLHIAGSKSAAKGWGHVMTTVILVLFGGHTNIATLGIIALSLVTGCLVFTSIRVIAHSFTFWLGPVEAISERYAESLFLFALYPTNIYSGLLQIVMFTVIPAGVISYLPVELIRGFSWEKLAALILATSCFVALAFFVFYRGLRRYESGNQFGVRG